MSEDKTIPIRAGLLMIARGALTGLFIAYLLYLAQLLPVVPWPLLAAVTGIAVDAAFTALFHDAIVKRFETDLILHRLGQLRTK